MSLPSNQTNTPPDSNLCLQRSHRRTPASPGCWHDAPAPVSLPPQYTKPPLTARIAIHAAACTPCRCRASRRLPATGSPLASTASANTPAELAGLTRSAPLFRAHTHSVALHQRSGSRHPGVSSHNSRLTCILCSWAMPLTGPPTDKRHHAQHCPDSVAACSPCSLWKGSRLAARLPCRQGI